MSEDDIANFEELLMLKADEFIGVLPFFLLEFLESGLIQPEGRDDFALLIGLELECQPQGDRCFVIGLEGADASLLGALRTDIR